jgi:hypothetical protein
MKNFIKIFCLCFLCMSIGYGASSTGLPDPSSSIFDSYREAGKVGTFNNNTISVIKLLTGKADDFLNKKELYAENWLNRGNKSYILDAYKEWYNAKKAEEARIEVAGKTGIIDAKELEKIEENKKMAQVVKDKLGVSDVNDAKTNIESLIKAKDENTNLKVMQVTKGIDQTVLENAIKDPDIQKKLELAQKSNLQGSATATNINETNKLKDGEYIFKTNSDKTVEIYKQEGGNLIPSGIKFTDIDSAKKFESVRDVMIGKINIDLVTKLDENIRNIFAKQETKNLINNLRNQKLKTEDLFVVLQGNEAILQENGKNLYKGSFQEVILVKLAYSMLSALESSSFFGMGGNNPLALTEKSNAELEEIHKLLGVKNQEDALKILQQQQKDSLFIKDINTKLGASSLQESLENLSKMGDLSKKLQEIKNEANNLKDSMTALPPNLSGFNKINQYYILEFQEMITEIMESASGNANSLLKEINELNEYLVKGLKSIEAENYSESIAVLKQAHSIASKYEKFSNDFTVNKISNILNKEITNPKDIENKKKQYESIFLDVYQMKLAKQIKEDVIEDKDPLSTALKVIENYTDNFSKITDLSAKAKENKSDVEKFFNDKKTEITKKIKEKNEGLYKEYLPIYNQQKNVKNSDCKPSLLDFLTAPLYAILILENSNNTNKFMKLDEIKESLPYLDNNQRKATYAYLYQVIEKFDVLNKEYKFMNLYDSQLKLFQIQDLLIRVKNSINEELKLFTPTSSQQSDYDKFKKEKFDKLISGDQRKIALRSEINNNYENIAKNLEGFYLDALKNVKGKDENDIRNNEYIANCISSLIEKIENIKTDTLEVLLKEIKAINDKITKSKTFIIQLNIANKSINGDEKNRLDNIFKKLQNKTLELMQDQNINKFADNNGGPPPLGLLMQQQGGNGGSKNDPNLSNPSQGPSINLLSKQDPNLSNPSQGPSINLLSKQDPNLSNPSQGPSTNLLSKQDPNLNDPSKGPSINLLGKMQQKNK